MSIRRWLETARRKSKAKEIVLHRPVDTMAAGSIMDAGKLTAVTFTYDRCNPLFALEKLVDKTNPPLGFRRCATDSRGAWLVSTGAAALGRATRVTQ